MILKELFQESSVDSLVFNGPLSDSITGRQTIPLKSPKNAVRVKTLKTVRNAWP